MKSVIRRSSMSRRRPNESTTPLHLFANSRLVVTMSGLLLGELRLPRLPWQRSPR